MVRIYIFTLLVAKTADHVSFHEFWIEIAQYQGLSAGIECHQIWLESQRASTVLGISAVWRLSRAWDEPNRIVKLDRQSEIGWTISISMLASLLVLRGGWILYISMGNKEWQRVWSMPGWLQVFCDSVSQANITSEKYTACFHPLTKDIQEASEGSFGTQWTVEFFEGSGSSSKCTGNRAAWHSVSVESFNDLSPLRKANLQT